MKYNITAKVIADSVCHVRKTKRITTLELEYPRFIHSEFMTHRLFSRNAASSRAIPIAKAIRLILENTARPYHWGLNEPGMSASEECHERVTTVSRAAKLPAALERNVAWDVARDDAIYHAEAFARAGYHKQIVNRLIEPFAMIKVVVTATEWGNFFNLRSHPDAQPEIKILADAIIDAMALSDPKELSEEGDWHVPYYADGYWVPYEMDAAGDLRDINGHTAEEALAISSSCCAQVSYRVLDESLEKAVDIYNKLVTSKPVHASPFEHQATPIMEWDSSPNYWEEGVTHMDRKYNLWSGNFMGWIQHRQLIPGNYAETVEV
ncbi:FAD-dependent thymidylate synthase [Stenotrophomonas maltophilia phage vB_SmaM_Ps15]|uniref:FAD-dependent thymidylate synthase n=1 Tax=Stenotrophomonas maltophilia phage vB_SmaM_Ps15 TaxID=3071007 RepID=A0AAE9JWS0_9CAUD|nr:thymidylate synthase [Stenotrophomonas maltophilia phage vB_SmaM_Ps15]UMO77404.1 FAD-dependent thymidylate synthase [Stenotrophomonas maltophilia phage vB_SmaM_Ps15]